MIVQRLEFYAVSFTRHEEQKTLRKTKTIAVLVMEIKALETFLNSHTIRI